MKIKNRRPYWPKYLIVPDEKQFLHGSWIEFDLNEYDLDEIESDPEIERLKSVAYQADYGRLQSKKDMDELRYKCGTQCCLVGWAALAMGEQACLPCSIKNPATAMFLNKFMEFAGFEPTKREPFESQHEFIERTAERASDVFEGVGHTDIPDHKKLSPRRARNLWMATAEHFGYDTKNLVG